MPHKIMIFLLAHIFETIKLLLILGVAFLAGELTSLIDTANSHPAITSVLAGGLVAILIRFVDKHLEGRNKTIKTADKVLELEHQDKKELRAAHEKLMAEKEAWYKLQNDRLQAKSFEVETRARKYRVEAEQTNHKALNELMRLQNIILGLQRTLVINGIEVPESVHINLTKYFLPVWQEEGEANEFEQHKTEDTETDTSKVP